MNVALYECGRCGLLVFVGEAGGLGTTKTCMCGTRGQFEFVGEATLTVKEPVPQSISTEGEDVAEQG